MEQYMSIILYIIWLTKNKATFEDIEWILAKTNYKLFITYGLDIIPAEAFMRIDIGELLDNPKKYYYPKYKPEKKLLPEVDFIELHRVFHKWKWYGRFIIKIKNWWKC